MGKRVRLQLAALAGLLILSACGGAGGDNASSTGRSAAEPPAAEETAPPPDTATPTLTEAPPEPTSTPTSLPATPTPTLDLCTIFPETCFTPTPSRCQVLAESIRGTRNDFPPSIPSQFCATASNYVQPSDQLMADATEELHVIGVYEGSGAAHGPFTEVRVPGDVDVVVRPRSKPVVLALMSYEPVRWHIILRPGAVVSRVLTMGYYEQQVDGVDQATVVNVPAGEACEYTYGWEVRHNSGGGSYGLAIAEVRDRTGLIESSFQGCYVGDRFEIPHWDGEPPTTKPTPVVLNEDIPRADMSFSGCHAVMAESQYCLTTNGSGPAVVGLDTGTVCSIVTSEDLDVFQEAASLSWRGEAMYVCSWSVGLLRVSLLDGRVESAEVRCGAVADYGNELVLGSGPFGSGLTVYPDYDAVLSDAPSAKYVAGGDSRMTVHGDRLYSAWHSTNTINVFDLAANTLLPPIILEGYDGWILGMAVTDAGELVISGDTWGDTISVFDVATGAKLRELRPTEAVVGLACIDRR